MTAASVEEARRELAQASAAGRSVRIMGAGTKLGWGRPTESDLELHTTGLDRILEHNAGDLTAVLEAGVPLARAQEAFATEGQMLALDPWLGAEGQATVGGVLATSDSGPLAHRYGAARDLVLGMTVVLADGTVARSGGQVIKNVAGYDVAKLFCGSYGTLGLIASVNVRLHPLPEATATAIGVTRDPAVLAEAARTLAPAPLDFEALDVAWAGGAGRLLARCGGASARLRAERTASLMRQAGLGDIELPKDDEDVWEAQRAGQRSTDRVTVRVGALPRRLPAVLQAATASSARVVARPTLGVSFLSIEPEALDHLIEALPRPASRVLLDAPEGVRRRVEPWGPAAATPVIGLMRRVKERFDPARTCNPGLFVGGI